MAVRRRGKKWVADYYDGFRIRRWKTFRTQAEAKDFEAKQRAERDTATAPTVDADITLTMYAAKWLADLPARDIKPQTVNRCEGALRVHVLPRLGHIQVRELGRPAVRKFLLAKLSEDGESLQGVRPGGTKRKPKRLARGTVKHLFMVLSGILSAAVEDGLIKANPVHGLWRGLFAKAAKRDKAKPKAFDAEQARAFLTGIARHAPQHYAAFATMMWAALRVGEAMALTTGKVNLKTRTITVDSQLFGTTKDARERTVDVAAALVDVLAPLLTPAAPKVVTLSGEPLGEPPAAPAGPWLFYPELGPHPTTKDEHRVYKAMCRAFARVLRLSGLPKHHTLHSLRHTYGSLLISKGVSPAYVQKQMGHASVSLTVDTYGSWLPVKVPGAVDALAAETAPGQDGSRMVATATSATPE